MFFFIKINYQKLLTYISIDKIFLQYKALCETFSEKCPVGKHWRQFRSHQDCFVASDAVTWMRRELKTDKFKANISRLLFFFNVAACIRELYYKY